MASKTSAGGSAARKDEGSKKSTKQPSGVGALGQSGDGGATTSTGANSGPTSSTASVEPQIAANGASASATTAMPAAGLSSDNMTPGQMAAVLSYFKRRGFKKGEDTLKAEMDALATGVTPAQALSSVGSRFGSPSVGLYELAVKSAPREPNASGSASSTAATANGAPATAATGPLEKAAIDAMLLDPTDRSRGFSKLRNWCEGSLDIYQPELLPLLLPLFVHSYIDLIELGQGAAAAAFYTANSWTFLPLQAALLSDIRALSLPSHVDSDPLAQRFRTERYTIKMSTTVFSLLLGWLTDGGGPAGGAGAGEGVGDDGKGDQDKRARDAMLKIINERCRLQVIDIKPQQLDRSVLEEGTGLTGTGPSYPSTSGRPRKYPALQAAVVSDKNPVAEYNHAAAGPQLKLGANIPLSEKLQAEVDREVRGAERQESVTAAAEKIVEDQESTAQPAPPKEIETTAGTVASRQHGLLQPTYADLPPQAPVYRVIDIKREVARVCDARKALRFNLSLNTTNGEAIAAASKQSGPSFMSGVRDASFNAMGEDGARAARTAALPSICSYTYHDADDGLTCSQFSEDLSLMAAGFEESYVQVWSLKGEPLRGLKSNFNLSQIRDRKTLDRYRERTTRSTRKLIGHSGPVYDVAFDNVGGSAMPPRFLLSASGDATCRLWSLDTLTALVSYRGHQQPVWSVEWSPLGLYFATASADKTARLWHTERINPLRMYAGHLSDVDCLAFHPNSLYLATGSSDKTCRLWDVQRGACVRLFVGHQSAVSCVKISPDGRLLASAGAGNAPSVSHVGDDCSISIWDLGTGSRVKKMLGHTAPVLAMDFSADGSMLVSSGADCQVRCWDVRVAGGARKPSAFGSSGGGSTMTTNDGAGALSSSAAGAQDAAALAASIDKGGEPASAAGFKSALPTAVSLEAAQQNSTIDCISTLYTKQTPMLDVHFTPRNLCLTAGAFDASL